MFVGEAPGAEEDRQGRPFVGPAGRLLNRLLAFAGFSRAEVYITNVVKCRPPGNRLPTPAEAAACRPYLLEQIRLISPRIIVCPGALATQALVDPRARITKVRGTTVIRRLLEALPPGTAAGFYTEEVREGGKRTGFVAQIVGGPRIVLARASGASRCRVGRYAVEVEAFEEVVLRPLSLALKDMSRRFLVIDEIGKMELLAPSFAELVLACLDDPRPLAATVMLAPHPFVDRIKARQDAEVIVLNADNRDRLPMDLAEKLAGLAGYCRGLSENPLRC